MLGSNRPSDSQAEGCVEALGGFRLPVPGENTSPRGRFFVLAISSERSDPDHSDGFWLLRLCRTTIATFPLPAHASGQ